MMESTYGKSALSPAAYLLYRSRLCSSQTKPKRRNETRRGREKKKEEYMAPLEPGVLSTRSSADQLKHACSSVHTPLRFSETEIRNLHHRLYCGFFLFDCTYTSFTLSCPLIQKQKVRPGPSPRKHVLITTRKTKKKRVEDRKLSTLLPPVHPRQTSSPFS